MSKRKASKAAVEEPIAKRGAAAAASVGVGAAAASSSAAASDADNPDDRIAAVNLAVQQRARCSATVAVLLQNLTGKSSVELMTALTQQLAADAQRPEPLIELNHKLADGGTLLMLLIDVLRKHTIAHRDASDDVPKRKRDACAIFCPQLPHVLKLVRAYDVSLLLKENQPAFNLLCINVVPFSAESWSYRMAEALLRAGSDPSIRDRYGWTPLHHWTLSADSSACGPLLLLRHGAQLDTQTSNEGWSVLHMLVRSARMHREKMLPVLRQLANSGYLALADFTLLNNAGQTALQMAEALVQQEPGNEAAAEVLQTLHAHSLLWNAHIRPVTLSLLSHSDLLPDLADIVLAYVDGGERPSEKLAAGAASATMKVNEVAGSSSSASAAAAAALAHA